MFDSLYHGQIALQLSIWYYDNDTERNKNETKHYEIKT